MVQIHEDRESEIEEHQKIGSQNKALVDDMARKSVADLQFSKSQTQMMNTEIVQLERQIKEKWKVFENQQKKSEKLSLEYER